MKKAEIDLITEFLVKTQNMASDAVAKLFIQNGEEFEYAPDALQTMLQSDATRVRAFKDKEEAERRKGYDKAKAETLAKFEADVKAKFGVDSEKTGIELLEEVITTKTPAPAEGKMTAEKMKLDPIYLALEKENAKKHSEELGLVKKEFETYKETIATEKVFSNIANTGLKVLDEKLKPIFSKNETTKANQRQLIVDALKNGFTYQENDGEITILKDGKRHEDIHGKPISFETHMKEIAGQWLDFEEGGAHSSTGASNTQKQGAQSTQGQQGQANTYKGPVPNNDDEYTKLFPTLSAEDRIGMDKAYTEKQKAG